MWREFIILVFYITYIAPTTYCITALYMYQNNGRFFLIFKIIICYSTGAGYIISVIFLTSTLVPLVGPIEERSDTLISGRSEHLRVMHVRVLISGVIENNVLFFLLKSALL